MGINVIEEQGDSIRQLSDEELESINGGIIHLFRDTCKFEVIDDKTGDVLGTFEYDDLEGAKQYAREIGVEDRLVYSSVVWQIRAQYQAQTVLEESAENW